MVRIGLCWNPPTRIIDRDLTKQALHSPRHRLEGFVVAARAIDKCRASLQVADLERTNGA